MSDLETERQKLRELRFESYVVFTRMSNIIENMQNDKNLFSPEGLGEYFESVGLAKQRLEKLFILLTPGESKVFLREVVEVQDFSSKSILLRAIKLMKHDKRLFISEDDRLALHDALVRIQKYWD